MKAGNAKGGFGAGAKKMGGGGKKPMPPFGGKSKMTAGPRRAPPMATAPPMPSDNDGDEMGGMGFRKGGSVKR